MNYAFISMLVPDEMSAEINDMSKKNMQDAANALQWHIYSGLYYNLNSEIKLINTLPVGSYPQFCKKMFFKRSVFKTDACNDNVNISFFNIKLIRKYSQSKHLLTELKNWVSETEGDKTVFVYTASAVFLKAIKKIKKKYPDLIICDIIADLPLFSSLSSKNSLLIKSFRKHLANESLKCLDSIDYYVLLTKHMAQYLKIQKPYCIMEGISTEGLENKSVEDISKLDNSKKIIFYSGTLHRKFGVLNLVNAFSSIDKENYCLQLCGIGDCEKDILSLAEHDKRIKFFGQLKRSDVLNLQQKATVLVNPRQNTEEFTKYSFPSKNIEYLSTGVPMIAYKLDGIPDEYDDYIFYVKNNSIDALKQQLIDVCEMPEALRIKKGRQAQDFVIKEKNKISQTKKIVELISK